MLSAGFDAAVVRRVEQQRSGHIRKLSYAKPIFETIRSYEYPELRIYSDVSEPSAGTEPQIRAKWSFVVNLPCYAMGLGIAPDANGTDGVLDVCTFRGGSLWKGLKYLAGVIMGRHENWDDCVTLRAQSIRIESDAHVPYQIDGDMGGYLPVDIEILPQRLTLLVPEDWHGGKQ
jgi:diacylglycerol kinase family enzyme